MPRILLGVTGGIAAYKMADLAGALIKYGCEVKVIMTEKAKMFITPLTMAVQSKSPVLDDASEWLPDSSIKHIELGKWLQEPGDMFIIAPATANTIAKFARGIADNLLTSTYLARPKNTEVLICPAMNTKMWEAQETQDNILALRRKLGHTLMDPEYGLLACGDYGVGKLPSVRKIVEMIKSLIPNDIVFEEKDPKPKH
jgi:phosphopantothenoylcysteine decarboxylase